VRFRMAWPENTEPSWHVDLLLANLVISPVLEEHRSDIALWRFHRRAARDQTGHQFSFIFYASPETALAVFHEVDSTALLKEMEKNGFIVEARYDDTDKVKRPNLGETSDGRWSPELKTAWPYFIMGVSETWLRLVADMASQESGEYDPSSLDDTLLLYHKVNERLNALWENEGQHAFLHHLNAVFGYERIRIYMPDALMRF
jgi:hypothetical protein